MTLYPKSLLSCLLAVGLCALGSVALAADGAGTAELALEQPTMSTTGTCTAARLDLTLFASSGGKDGSQQLVTCTADCGPHPDVSCQTNGTCVAVDRACPGQRGYVTCNGVTTYCPSCSATCTEGSYRFYWTGNCCDCGLDERAIEKCIGGQWVLQNTGCGPGVNCPRCPF